MFDLRCRTALLMLITCASLTAMAQTSVIPLTPEQQALYDSAKNDFAAQHYSDALPKFQALHQQLPDDATVSKFAAETAVNVGDFSAAKALIEPLLASAPDNPQALGIAAHLYGQQHDVAKRDATLARLQALHDAGTIKLDSLPVEKDTLPGGKSVTIFYFLTPFSRFNIVLMARFYDAEGKQTHRITLESDDIDQVQFAKQHPTEAAAGVRIYSMDSYTDHVDASGRLTGQTHGTLCPAPGCFLTGRPTYEFFREHTYGTTASPETPISSTNSIVPSSAPK